MIQAAKELGQPHIVRHSMWGSDNSRIIQQGNQVEEELKSSGPSWTLLRPSFFTQNFLISVQSIASDGARYWPMEDAGLAMIDIRDIVDCAVTVLTEDGHLEETYTLTGPAAVSFHKVADALGEPLDKEVNYVSVPGEAARESMIGMGVNEFVAKGYIEVFGASEKDLRISQPITSRSSRASPPVRLTSSHVTSPVCSSRRPPDPHAGARATAAGRLRFEARDELTARPSLVSNKVGPSHDSMRAFSSLEAS